MKRFILQFSSLFLAMTLITSGNTCLAAAHEVRIGVLAFRPIEITKQQWQPTADYLSAQIPGNHFTFVPMNYKDLDLAINRREFDFVLTNPEHFVTIREDHGLLPIATLMPNIEGHPEPTFGGVIFARADRTEIKSLADVRGKTVASPSDQSLGGYSMQIWALLKEGISKSKFSKINFTGMPHDKVVMEVLAGKADIGFVRTGVLEGMAHDGTIHLDQINVLNRQSADKYPQLLSTELYPEWPIAAELDVPLHLQKLVTLALFRIQPGDSAAKLGGYYGFAPAGDYTSIESLMHRIGENPARTHEFDFKDIARKYSLELSMGSLFVILTVFSFVLYLARINRKLIRASIERGDLSKELATAYIRLEESNKNLEKRVAERTLQLQKSESRTNLAMMELQLQKLALDEHAIVSITDVTGTITYVNEKFCQISQYSNEELVGQNHIIVNSGHHPKGFFKEMYSVISRGKIWHDEVCNRAKDGSLFWLDMTVVPFKDESEKIYQYIAIRTDITVRKKSALEIQKLAFYDPLTGLPNRRLFMDRLNHSMSTSIRNEKHGALMFIDLDNFKTLNDTRGHNVGDKLLIEVARRLSSCVREEDTVARLGGDEFVIVLENLSSDHNEASANAERLAYKILNELNQIYVIDGIEHHSSPSIGVAIYCDNSIKVEDLIRHADTAMYQAKDAGRNTVRFYDPLTQERLESRSDMERELRHAMENEEFQLYYQIQVNEEYLPVGAEALLRWNNPKIGKISPAEFIPLAEETGLIVPIGEWVLETACAQIKKWDHDPVTSRLELAINVSMRQFRDLEFVSKIKRLIGETGINPKRLKLEITESMVMDNNQPTIGTMNELKSLGIKFSMDDFGTGYSSLSYIKRLPLDQIKIDQSFVRDLLTSVHDRSIVRTIIAMAQSLNLEIIAEGVETEEQRQFLILNGCKKFQGYLFGKPVSIDQFDAFFDAFMANKSKGITFLP